MRMLTVTQGQRAIVRSSHARPTTSLVPRPNSAAELGLGTRLTYDAVYSMSVNNEIAHASLVPQTLLLRNRFW